MILFYLNIVLCKIDWCKGVEMVKYCANCGRELPDEAMYCPECGKK